jgi:hypothetical protein
MPVTSTAGYEMCPANCVVAHGCVRPANPPYGRLGLAGAGKTGPPSRFPLSQSPAGKRALPFFASVREGLGRLPNLTHT